MFISIAITDNRLFTAIFKGIVELGTGLLSTNPHCRISKQWGTNTINSSGQNFITPISTSGIFIIMILDNDYGCDRFAAMPTAGNSFMVWNKNDNNNFAESNFQWFAVSVIN